MNHIGRRRRTEARHLRGTHHSTAQRTDARSARDSITHHKHTAETREWKAARLSAPAVAPTATVFEVRPVVLWCCLTAAYTALVESAASSSATASAAAPCVLARCSVACMSLASASVSDTDLPPSLLLEEEDRLDSRSSWLIGRRGLGEQMEGGGSTQLEERQAMRTGATNLSSTQQQHQ